ncbi:MAG TPA: glycoside hydrolase family 2 TIM barrel-domain containing protein [Arachidicoccus sp.]|nr:glycoside hydrolase family 2 TIM barrel-domain containing protein [Arachidicoccus sp.]
MYRTNALENKRSKSYKIYGLAIKDLATLTYSARLLLLFSILLIGASLVKAQTTASVSSAPLTAGTRKLMLSGTGKDHTVDWDFYCTAGQNSGKWSQIAVPSNWELQGFGAYNYGLDKDSLRLNEKGLYKYKFNAPAAWKGQVVRIVFEGVMTDATVKINGQLAGPMHQGAFYVFRYDISKLLRYGKENVLEVTVAKNSANLSVNKAERKGDFWIFGGIFRPVYLEAMPTAFLDRVSVDGKADGSFKALAHVALPDLKNERFSVEAQLFDQAGKPVGDLLEGAKTNENNEPVKKSGNTATKSTSKQEVFLLEGTYRNIHSWTPETPDLYKIRFTLKNGGKIIHQVEKKIGFRTVEVRQRDGIYVNGVKIKFKGVNHHSFWPSTGRTTNRQMSIDDVLMLKDMNMNAVRMSHYPPDAHFLDACDSLGLFVLDELTGWHQKYDTAVGSKLVGEMIAHDENHPSIIMWDNGNEGGFNFGLDPLFADYDLQKRPLIHPWAVFGGMDTQHYINYDYGNGTHLHGHNIVFPTEFLHGLYDGGLGAGLGDYWKQMWTSPLSAGGFLWVFADEAVVRTDRGGVLDADGDHGPDGIVGPYHEKEGSYNAIKEIWSPVFIDHREITPAFDGRFHVENRYSYTNLNQLQYDWQLLDAGAPEVNKKQSANHGIDSLTMVSSSVVKASGSVDGTGVPDVAPGAWGDLQLQLPKDFEQADFLKLRVRSNEPGRPVILEKTYPIKRPARKAAELIANLKQQLGSNASLKTESSAAHYIVEGARMVDGGAAEPFSYQFNRQTGILEKIRFGKDDLPFNNGPVLCDGTALITGFTMEDKKDSVVLTASFEHKSDLSKLRWVIYPDGLLKMDVGYFPHQYDFDYAGVSFDFPEAKVKGVQRMGAGPFRVWKNRMEGVQLGTWYNDYNNTITGENVPKMIYPEFKGYFADLYWMKLLTDNRPITVICADEDVFLRLFTPQSPAKPYNTAPAFPKGSISFMHGITPIGTKSQVAENMGPSGRKNMYYDYGKDKEYEKPLTLYFYFGTGQ